MANVIDLLSDNYYMDNSNLGIAKSFYKRQGFQDTMSYLKSIDSVTYTEIFIIESTNLLNTIIDDDNVIITQSNNIRYEDVPYIINDDKTITDISLQISEGGKALIYCSIPKNGEIYYKTKFINN